MATHSPQSMDGENPSTVMETKKILNETAEMVDTNRDHCSHN